MNDTTEDLRAKRAASSQRLYLVFMEPVEGAGDRTAARGAHFDFVANLEKSGALVMGGPFVDEETGKPQGKGMFVLKATSAAEAEAMVKDDPFVTGGFRTFRIQPWRVAEGRIGLTVSFSDRDWSLV